MCLKQELSYYPIKIKYKRTIALFILLDLGEKCNTIEKKDGATNFGGSERSSFEQPRSLQFVQINSSIYHKLNNVKKKIT